jgi:hypothetical protein
VVRPRPQFNLAMVANRKSLELTFQTPEGCTLSEAAFCEAAGLDLPPHPGPGDTSSASSYWLG